MLTVNGRSAPLAWFGDCNILKYREVDCDGSAYEPAILIKERKT